MTDDISWRKILVSFSVSLAIGLLHQASLRSPTAQPKRLAANINRQPNKHNPQWTKISASPPLHVISVLSKTFAACDFKLNCTCPHTQGRPSNAKRQPHVACDNIVFRSGRNAGCFNDETRQEYTHLIAGCANQSTSGIC
jgi:hypothetical protein